MKIIMSEENLSEKSPVISVALPVYNGERYLAEAIDSILAQTFTNFELIIIDDGSTDASLDILSVYEKRDPRIRLISRENRNLVATLNEIIGLARGTWIARMDQDDIALPQRFERQLDLLNQTGADICGSWVKFFGTRDKRVYKYPLSDDAIKMAMLFACPFAHPTVMMRAGLVKNNCYDKDWESCEDYDLWERMSRAGLKFTNVQEVLLLYRKHHDQISTKSSNKQKELTALVRKRYWEYISDFMKFDVQNFEDILNISFESKKLNMDNVDSILVALLQGSRGEARNAIAIYIPRIYFQAANGCPDIVNRWARICKFFDCNNALKISIYLIIIRTFHINYEGVFFKKITKIHNALIGNY